MVNLPEFTRILCNKQSVRRYTPQYFGLRHVRTEEGYEGILLISPKDRFIAVLNCNINERLIQAIDVVPEHRRKGIATLLLFEAERDFKCNALTVNKKNEGAISLYKQLGWKVVDETFAMFRMEKR